MSKPITHLDDAAYQHVEKMLPRADGGGPVPWWHGWAIREAFADYPADD